MVVMEENYGDNLVRTYSDAGKYIVQNETGIEYAEAVDVPNRYTYSETDHDIEIVHDVGVEEETE